MSKKTATIVEELVREPIRQAGMELVDIEFEFSKEQQGYVLSIYIDRPGGVRLSDCESISRMLDPILDEADPIEQSYFLCVSSPGLDRPIKKDSDLQRSLQKRLDIKLFAPIDKKKEFTGVLLSYTADTVCIESGGQQIALPRRGISLMRLHIDF